MLCCSCNFSFGGDGVTQQDDRVGVINEVSVREVWPNEAHDFTPWLARNLGRLGQALNLDLGTSGDTEARVGPFSLDILAQEAGPDGRKVAIENQLAWTDHTHLGQLLTYAAGLDAQVAIWVAPDFTDQHKAAIEWLNRWTLDEVEFYAVKVRAIRIDDSKPAAIFEKVAGPTVQKRQAHQTVSRVSDEERGLYRRFEQSLQEDLVKRGVTENNTGVHGCYLYPSLKYNEARVLLWLGHRGGADISRIFNSLKAEQGEIESEFAVGEWIWERRGNNQRYAWIWLTRPASINDPTEKLDEIRAWLVDTVIQFREVFNPRVGKILAEMEVQESGE